MHHIKFLLLICCIFLSSIGGVNAAIISSGDIQKVTESVLKVQSGPSYTAPTGYEEKGFVGTIVSKIFDPIGKIYSDYILAFQNIISSNNTIPVWNATTKIFDPTNISYVGGLVGVGISNPETRLHVNGVGRFDNGIQVDGNTIITPSGNGVAAHSPDANRYGFFKIWNGNGEEGAYFGYGNGNDRVDIALRGNADRLIIPSGNVGIGVSNPTNKLQVAGSILASQNISANRFCNSSGTNCFTSPITCSGGNKALTWNGTSWVCNTINTSPTVTCSGSNKALGWNGSSWVCNTISTGSSSSSGSSGGSSTSSSGGSTSSSSGSSGGSSTSSSGGSTSSTSSSSSGGTPVNECAPLGAVSESRKTLINSYFLKWFNRISNTSGLCFWGNQSLTNLEVNIVSGADGNTQDMNKVKQKLSQAISLYQNAGVSYPTWLLNSNQKWVHDKFQFWFGRQPAFAGMDFWASKGQSVKTECDIAFGAATSGDRNKVIQRKGTFISKCVNAGHTTQPIWMP